MDDSGLAAASSRDAIGAIRERETYRYLDTKAVHAYVDAPESLLPSARPSPDSSLTAFAQLGLLRLNAQRVFISLFDRKYEYIIAEATPVSGLRGLSNQATEEGLLLCGLAITHDHGIAGHVLESLCSDLQDTPLAEEEKETHLEGTPLEGTPLEETPLEQTLSEETPLAKVIIPDLHADAQCSSKMFVKTNHEAKFFAGVPIQCPSGSIIGVYSIVDSRPRTSITDIEVQFLHDIAKTIMDHLEMFRAKREVFRSNRMVRGLGSFVEGKATMSQLGAAPLQFQLLDDVCPEGRLNVRQQDLEADLQQNAKKIGDHSDPNLLSIAAAKDSPRSPSYFPPIPREIPPLSYEVAPEETKERSQSQRASGADETHSNRRNSFQLSPNSSAPSFNETTRGTGIAQSLHSSSTVTPTLGVGRTETHQIFARASNIIRESIEVEGVLFFDASVGSFGGLVRSGSQNSEGESQSGSRSPSQSRSRLSSPHLSPEHEPDASGVVRNCAVFGYSMTNTSSINGERANAGHLTVPERFLRILIRRYPGGKIFNFTEDGQLTSDSDTEREHNSDAPTAAKTQGDRRRKSNPFSRANEATTILSVFPGARSIIAFPMWDSHRERWFAGGVAWTHTATRVFTARGELSYLRAFGMVLMAEVARVDALKSEKSKSDVLGSISHELRSPLHGILGGAEILQSTDIDGFQGSVLHTVETCGLTLLDTINHLLDHAKINNHVRAKKGHRDELASGQKALTNSTSRMDMMGLTSDVEVDASVEEVVESVFAGHEFRHFSGGTQTLDLSRDQQALHAAQSLNSVLEVARAAQKDRINKVKVLLDITPAENWTFTFEGGAFRRILMNVFGNALKFTSKGHISVKIFQESKQNNSPLSEVKLVVEDSGRGMHNEFLCHHALSPFAQEDSLSSGIGLGLSITNNIISDLGGSLAIQSKLGQGTTVLVSLPLTRTMTSEPRDQGAFSRHKKRLSGLRVSLLGFTEDLGTFSGQSAEMKEEWQLPRPTIERLCRDWLCLDVLAASDATTAPDVYIATLAGANMLTASNIAGNVRQPIMVICPSPEVARQLARASKTLDKNGVFEYISQPCGPRKLAKTFSVSLDRWADIQIQKTLLSTPTLLVPDAGSQSKSDVPVRTETPEQPSTGSTNPSPRPLLSSLHPPPPTLQPSETHPSPNPRRTISSPAHSGSSSTSSPILPFLLVDDNEINLKLLSAYLKRKSLPYMKAMNGKDGVDLFRQHHGRFSCVFMDINMPVMDGLAATRAIREYELKEKGSGAQHVMVVVLTGLGSEETKKEARGSGVDEFRMKPVRLKELDGILAHLAEARAGRAEAREAGELGRLY